MGKAAWLPPLVAIALCLAGVGDALTAADVSLLKAALRSTILSVTASDEYGLTFRPLVAAFVRLAFHACIGDRCTGCLDVTDPSNAHLDVPVRALSQLRRRVNVSVSYGDLFALAGIVALNVGEEIAAARGGGGGSKNITHAIRFKQGRVDCPTAPYASRRQSGSGGGDYPSSAGGLDHVISWFQLNFGFSAVQTVAVMGLHKLGGLKRASNTSDLFAQWSFAPDALDNGYYQDLVRVGDWRAGYVLAPAAAPNRTYMWRRQRSNTAFMFNCDVALYKNIKFGSCDPAAVTCSYEACPLSKTSATVVAFAQDNGLWLRTMSAAFTAMVEKGY